MAKAKAKAVEEVNLPPKVKKEITNAMADRARAKSLEEEAEVIKKRANETLLPLLAAYDIKSYSVEGVGTIGRKVSSGSRIDPAKLKEELLIAGVDIDIITQAVESSTKSWSTEYVDFRRK